MARAAAHGGRINLSPKGLAGTFAVLDARTVAHVDLTGSGIETVAQPAGDGRIVPMFCAFEARPASCTSTAGAKPCCPTTAGCPRGALHRAPGHPVRHRRPPTGVTGSCKFGVPVLRFDHERTKLDQWASRKGPDGVAAYQRIRGPESIDGLPGLAAR